MITTVFTLHNRYAASAISNTLDLLASFFAPFLDKLLPYLLYKNGLSPSRLVDIIRIAKKTLFPNGSPAPPPIDPTPEEQVIILERLAAKIQQVIPGWLTPFVFGAHPLALEQTINDILDPLSSAECNTHLVMFVLDSVLMTLIPEMATTTDASMMDGPALTANAQHQSQVTQPKPAERVPSRGSSNAEEDGGNGDERGRNPTPSQNSGMYVHV